MTIALLFCYCFTVEDMAILDMHLVLYIRMTRLLVCLSHAPYKVTSE